MMPIRKAARRLGVKYEGDTFHESGGKPDSGSKELLKVLMLGKPIRGRIF